MEKNLTTQNSGTKLLPALIQKDRATVLQHLAKFKDKNQIRYDLTLKIPSKERIPALTKTEAGYLQIASLLKDALLSTFANMNLRKGLNEDQIDEIAALIIDESHEDNLSLEDVLLFLYNLMTGKCGKIYDRMDIPTFFEIFEGYREERHLALHYIQYEAHCNFKAMGDTARTSEQLKEPDAAYQQALKEYNIKKLHEEKPIREIP